MYSLFPGNGLSVEAQGETISNILTHRVHEGDLSCGLAGLGPGGAGLEATEAGAPGQRHEAHVRLAGGIQIYELIHY